MRFGGTHQSIPYQVLVTDLRLVPVYLSKLYLSDSYMHIWVFFKDIPAISFLLPNRQRDDPQILRFQLSLTM